MLLRNLVNSFLGCLFSFFLFLWFQHPIEVKASLQTTFSEDNVAFKRSLESLRDLDYQTWQVVVYPSIDIEEKYIIRVVGYPGSLRFDHPNNLKVHSGIREWDLKDITLLNNRLADDSREAAAEFDISPLLFDLENNRPLRFSLKEAFSDLPIPPYLVSEWRSFLLEEVD